MLWLVCWHLISALSWCSLWACSSSGVSSMLNRCSFILSYLEWKRLQIWNTLSSLPLELWSLKSIILMKLLKAFLGYLKTMSLTMRDLKHLNTRRHPSSIIWIPYFTCICLLFFWGPYYIFLDSSLLECKQLLYQLSF